MTLTDALEHARVARWADEDTIREFGFDCAGMARTGQRLPETPEDWRKCFEAWVAATKRNNRGGQR